MKHRNSHLLVGYWGRLRKGRDVPDQADIDPRAIKRILPFVFILESSDPARPLYRLAGTSHCECYGAELKGTGYLVRWEAQSKSALTPLLRQSLATRTPVCLASVGASADCGMAQLETVLAPISFGDASPSRFIGIMQLLGDAGALAGKPIAFERLVGSQFICEDNLGEVMDYPPAPPRGGTVLRAPHLRLVVNRDKPALHFEPDETVQQIIEALEITPLRRPNPIA